MNFYEGISDFETRSDGSLVWGNQSGLGFTVNETFYFEIDSGAYTAGNFQEAYEVSFTPLADGNMLAVWGFHVLKDIDGDGLAQEKDGDLFYRIFNPNNGNFVTDEVQFTQGPSTTLGDIEGQYIADSYNDVSTPEINIGGPVSTDGEILSITRPNIESISNDKLLITWTGTDSTIEGQLISKSGDNLGSKFSISSNSNGNQYNVRSTELLDGNIFVTWNDQSSSGYGQIISPTGGNIGSEFSIGTIGTAYSPIPISLSDGSVFVVHRISPGSSQGQFYNSDGSTSSDPLPISSINAKAAELSNGNIIITSGNDTIIAKIIDRSGNEVKSFNIHDDFRGPEQMSSVVALKDGGFAVTWQADGQDGDDFGLYMSIYDNDGVSVANNPILVNTKTSERQIYSAEGDQVSSIDQLDSGELVVVFHDREYPYYDIYAQKFDIIGDTHRIIIT